MKRHLYRGLLGGAGSAVEWGLAKQIDQAARGTRSQERSHAIQIWEGEGGRTPARPTPRASWRAA